MFKSSSVTNIKHQAVRNSELFLRETFEHSLNGSVAFFVKQINWKKNYILFTTTRQYSKHVIMKTISRNFINFNEWIMNTINWIQWFVNEQHLKKEHWLLKISIQANRSWHSDWVAGSDNAFAWWSQGGRIEPSVCNIFFFLIVDSQEVWKKLSVGLWTIWECKCVFQVAVCCVFTLLLFRCIRGWKFDLIVCFRFISWNTVSLW